MHFSTPVLSIHHVPAKRHCEPRSRIQTFWKSAMRPGSYTMRKSERLESNPRFCPWMVRTGQRRVSRRSCSANTPGQLPRQILTSLFLSKAALADFPTICGRLGTTTNQVLRRTVSGWHLRPMTRTSSRDCRCPHRKSRHHPRPDDRSTGHSTRYRQGGFILPTMALQCTSYPTPQTGLWRPPGARTGHSMPFQGTGPRVITASIAYHGYSG